MSTELPPLPPTDYVLGVEGDGYSEDRLYYHWAGYSEEDMKSYAQAAIAAECEACAATVEALEPHQWVPGSDQWGDQCLVKIVTTQADYAAAIRARGAAAKESDSDE